MNIVQSLWIGNTLTNIERAALLSFIKNGYSYHLYVYEHVENVPDEISIKDGNEILDSSEIFRYKNNSVSAFSNLFRFCLLYKKGGWWVDTDMFCIKKYIPTTPYVFVSEPDILYKNSVVNAGAIFCKKGDPILLEAIKICRLNKKKILNGEIPWGLGPFTVKHIVKKYNLEKYVKTWKFSNICNNHHFICLLNKNFKLSNSIQNKFYNDLQNLSEETFFIHTWNEKFRSNNINKNGPFQENSILDQLFQLYLDELCSWN